MLSVSLILLLSGLSQACDVVLKKSATVSKEQVRLSDIAKSYPSKYANLILCPSPYVNNSITLTRRYIESILKRRGINLKLCGSDTVKVISKPYLLTQEKLIDLIKDRDIVFITALPIRFKFYPYKLKLLSTSSSGNLRLYKIALIKNNKIYKTLTITAKSNRRERLIPVASRDIPLGERISQGDITFKKVKRILPTFILSSSSITGRITTSFIKKGSPFTLSNTKRFKPVRLGDIVKVEVVSGNIVIRTIAKALKGGYNGDIIPIMYISSKRVLPAKIIGNKEVLVQ